MTNEEPVEIPAVEKTVGQMLLHALYDEIANLRTPWVVTPQQQQSEILERLRSQVAEAVRVAVNRIATAGFEHVVAEIDSLTIKDEAKAALVLPRGTQDIHTLADRVKSKVVIVFADPDDYADGMHTLQAQADQPSLPLE